MWFASCTKLLTTVAVLQCVEKGLLNLDEPIGPILPEFANPDIIYGIDETTGAPLLKKAKNKFTMRHLLTHSSGMTYDVMNPNLMKMKEYYGQEPATRASPIIVRSSLPLL